MGLAASTEIVTENGAVGAGAGTRTGCGTGTGGGGVSWARAEREKATEVAPPMISAAPSDIIFFIEG